MLFLEEGQYYTESDAALRVARYLDGGWKVLSWLHLFPRFLRNAVYRVVARTRYRVFGRRDTCMIPTPALKARFLDQ